MKKRLTVLQRPVSSDRREPCLYSKAGDGDHSAQVKHVHPPATAEETEYQALKFYTFSSNLDFIINQVRYFDSAMDKLQIVFLEKTHCADLAAVYVG